MRDKLSKINANCDTKNDAERHFEKNQGGHLSGLHPVVKSINND